MSKEDLPKVADETICYVVDKDLEDQQLNLDVLVLPSPLQEDDVEHCNKVQLLR